jgi:hypothetical protein
MVEPPMDVAQKHDYYLQMMRKAKQFNDQTLIELIKKKIARLGLANAVSTSGGCIIIPFPTIENRTDLIDDEQLTWWLLLKLTLAIPGSLVALLLLTYYSM